MRFLLVLLVLILLLSMCSCKTETVRYCGTIVEKYKDGDEDGSRMIVVVQQGNEKIPLRVPDYSYVNSDIGKHACYDKPGQSPANLVK